MIVTTWDGHVRVDYVPGRSRLQVTVCTMGEVAELEPRPGFRTAFATTDPVGPPTFIGVDLANGSLPADIRTLLGPRLAAIADDVVAAPPRERWARLDLTEINELADGWAPYRARALATVPVEELADEELVAASPLTTVGSWAGGLWTSFGGEDLVAALRTLVRGPDFAVRGDPTDIPAEAVAHGTLRLPAGLAAAAGVAEDVGWSAMPRAIGVAVVFRAVPSDDAAGVALMVAFDDGRERWARFVPDGSERPVATILSTSEVDVLPGFRFRTANRGTDDH